MRARIRPLATALCIAQGFAPTALAQNLIDPTLQVETWVLGLARPTTFALLPQGSVGVLACEKETGRVIHIQNGVVQGIALDLAVNYASERGLLGIALHPDFALNGWVYLYYTPSSTGLDTAVNANALGHRVERYTWTGTALTSAQLILSLPVTTGPNHDGGILLFGPDRMLYGVIGDLNRDGQLENFPNGPPPDDTAIIFRIADDGSFPSDNPFFGLGGAMQKVYAYGVRNSFGMDFDPVNGVLWDTENGPQTYDEINRVLPGFNSGWEQIMGPDARDPEGLGDLWAAAGSAYSDPEFSWLSTIGVTTIRFIRGLSLGSKYENDCIVGDNNTGSLYQFEPTLDRTALVMPTPETADLVADNNIERSAFLFGSGFGVVTDIHSGPDGVYVSSLFTGRIYRIFRSPTDNVERQHASELRVWPNPGAGRTLVQLQHEPQAPALEARIYSPAGRLVRVRWGSGGALEWDGLGAEGEVLPAGVYLLRADTGTKRLEAKLVRLGASR